VDVKALLLQAYNDLDVVDLPEPTPGMDEVMIQVAACGICGSDVHGYDGSTGRRIPPIVMGHEAAGTVIAVGGQVSGFIPGDRVTFDSTVYCGACDFCQRGEVNLCDDRQVIGVSCGEYRRNGAFAEYLVVPARILFKLPGDTVLVIGAGMIGLLLLQAAKLAGAKHVMVADVDETRLAMGRDLGADETLCLSGDALTEEILRQTAQRGVDVVLEAVGREETIVAAVDGVRKGGAIALIGNITPQVRLPLQKIVSRQIRLQGSCASAGEYPEAIRLVASGAIRVDFLITAVAPLADGPAWFARLHAREPNLMKIVLDPRTHPENFIPVEAAS
jgi:L-iditol 2-dehydrogenase